ncbi:MAG: molybdopterin cofactor-binding domain-containing protein [Sphingobium sp.]|nr:xanthine dehydrogenase family protein molybdopterin-binding subunit [Sphingobium sp.]MCP5398097.1 xanthine dehydrogenase family protein molybdopterin-binding subunit [Sphingomonas sp.]
MPRSSETRERKASAIDRRSLLIGGGAAAGLMIAWGLWPRSYQPNLAVANNERLINAFLKIDTAGQIIIVVPQLEMGQGVTTVLPQILADELGADWRTVAVQGAPVNPLYANSLLARQFLTSDWSKLAGDAGDWALREYASREAMMLTGGSTSVRMFMRGYREAGASARILLCKAAAARWDADWESCYIENGIITDGQKTLRIGEVVSDAVGFTLPDELPLKSGDGEEERLYGRDIPRIDLPSKIDGSHNYAADIRIADMVFASIRQGPIGATGIKSLQDAEAKKVTGFLQLVQHDHWVAAVGTNWWAANKALDSLDPVFDVAGPPLDTLAIEEALQTAFTSDAGRRLYQQGELATAFNGARLVRAEYRVAPALHLAVEPPCATARVTSDLAEIWTASQAPAFCRRAVADALGMDEDQVILYPISAGGSFGRRMDHEPAVQAALIAQEIKRPVQLLWSRAEDIITDRPRPPAHARMHAKLVAGGRIEALSAKVAAPATDRETWDRIARSTSPAEAADNAGRVADARALSGMPSLYEIPHYAIDHYPTPIRLPTGRWRGNADSYSCFFTESFMDELAQQAGMEPLSFRMQHLSGQPRLAQCVTTAAAIGGWQGGVMSSGQGLACHAMDGGYIAMLVEASMERGSIRVKKITAAADIGAQPHPDIARQQIEGGIIFGLAAALGCGAEYEGGLPLRAIMGRMGLPRLADIGDVTIELLPSEAEPAGVGQIGVPAAAPALAGALYTLTGRRYRDLPLVAAS